MEMGHTHGQGALKRVTGSLANRASWVPQPLMVQLAESLAPGAAGAVSFRLRSVGPLLLHASALLQASTASSLGLPLGALIGRCYFIFPLPMRLSKAMSASWVGRFPPSPVLLQSLVIVCVYIHLH